jgi:hypothetical protein
MPNIPIKEEDYNGNENLLTVMMATHLEDILVEKFMKENGLSEFEAQDLSQVSNINYGMTQHHPMMYLCKIV